VTRTTRHSCMFQEKKGGTESYSAEKCRSSLSTRCTYLAKIQTTILAQAFELLRHKSTTFF